MESFLKFLLGQGIRIPVESQNQVYGSASLSDIFDAAGKKIVSMDSFENATIHFRLLWKWFIVFRDDKRNLCNRIQIPSFRAGWAIRNAGFQILQIRRAMPAIDVLQHLVRLEEVLKGTPEEWLDTKSFQLALNDFRQFRSYVASLPRPTVQWMEQNLNWDPLLKQNEESLELARQEANKRFLAQARIRYGDFLKNVEKLPLSEEQQTAVLAEEYRALVVAAAGSGKTSVLVAKAGYLNAASIAPPGRICLIAFNTKAAKEIEERIQNRLGISPTVKTFHALGLEILGEATREKPRLRKEFDPGQEMARKVLYRELIKADLAERPHESWAYLSGWEGLAGHLGGLRRPVRKGGLSWWEEWLLTQKKQSGNDGISKAKPWDPKAIQIEVEGELIEGRSPQELEILQFLRARGMQVEYEPDYPYQTADRNHSAYRPDFRIQGPNRVIYLEHQALRRDGSSTYGPSYPEKVDGVRRLHAKHRTVLVESFAWWWRADEPEHWTARLTRALEKTGIQVPDQTREDQRKAEDLLLRDPDSDARAGLGGAGVSQVKGEDASRLFFESLERFISLSRERGERVLSKEMPEIDNTPGGGDLLRVFHRILSRFEAWLDNVGGFDFPAMISEASAVVRAGKFMPPWSHLLIDEFQDISEGRSGLVQG